MTTTDGPIPPPPPPPAGYAVRFKTARCEKEYFGVLHPAVRDLVQAFCEWSRVSGLPEPTVTCVVRTPDENRAIYKGVDRFSWHLVRCAVDLRNHHYTPEQRRKAEGWLGARAMRPRWEFVPQDHGTGPHFHVAIRDARWRELYNPTPENKP